MSERLPRVDNLCKNPDNHKTHLCELLAAGKTDEVAKLQEAPKFVCNNCGKEANTEGALCAPGPMDV